MPKISFNFFCHRDIPLYADLCNLYIADERFNFTAGHKVTHGEASLHCQFTPLHTYFVEVEASENELALLADEIASRFLYSIWLKSAEVISIENRKGDKQYLKHSPVKQRFCSQCQPLMTDPINMVDISKPCLHCAGEHHLLPYELGFSQQDLEDLANKIQQGEQVCLGHADQKVYLSSSPINLSSDNEQQLNQRQKVLVTQPQAIATIFNIKQHEVLALSSFEKPVLRLTANEKDVSLAQVKTNLPDSKVLLLNIEYDVTFANSRLLIQLAAKLNQRDINWLYVEGGETNINLAWVNHAWAETRCRTTLHFDAPMPKHDVAQYQAFDAAWQKNVITWTIENTPSRYNTTVIQNKILPGIDAATCALHAGLLTTGELSNGHKPSQFDFSSSLKKVACIYLSNEQSSAVITQNKQLKINSFLKMPTIPNDGITIIEELKTAATNTIFSKYSETFTDALNLLKSIKLSDSTSPIDSLENLMALAAIITLPQQDIRQLTAQQKQTTSFELAQKFHAAALTYQGNNAPRIDFPLCAINNQDDVGIHTRTINWQKTLASLMSFTLAGANPSIVAFGFFDSFSDYLSNWIDHLEQEQGIDAVVLAGSDFRYSVLANRLCIRLEKNFPLLVNRQLDLDGANIAVGSLYLAKRRR